jgi:hypothetical protein
MNRHSETPQGLRTRQALAEVLKDEPQLEPFLRVEALPLPEPSPN